MPYCSVCKTFIADTDFVCPNCGNKRSNNSVPVNQNQTTTKKKRRNSYKFNLLKDITHNFSEVDINNNRLISVLCYIPILNIIPFIFCKRNLSPYLMFHENQGIVNSLLLLISWGLFYWGQVIWEYIAVALGMGIAVFLLNAIIGTINCILGKAKKIPIISAIPLLKFFM